MFSAFTMKLRLPLLLAALSIVGFVVAQYENYYNNEDTSSDKDGSSFSKWFNNIVDYPNYYHAEVFLYTTVKPV